MSVKTKHDEATTRRTIRILVVDDETSQTDLLSKYFEFEGYDVSVANDPYTALRRIYQEDFLIVISDICMPGMTGIDLLKHIKEYNGMIQVIMMTGLVKIENILAALRRGADDCFLKPIKDLDRLKATVDEAIAKLQKWEELMVSITRGEGEKETL